MTAMALRPSMSSRWSGLVGVITWATMSLPAWEGRDVNQSAFSVPFPNTHRIHDKEDSDRAREDYPTTAMSSVHRLTGAFRLNRVDDEEHTSDDGHDRQRETLFVEHGPKVYSSFSSGTLPLRWRSHRQQGGCCGNQGQVAQACHKHRQVDAEAEADHHREDGGKHAGGAVDAPKPRRRL